MAVKTVCWFGFYDTTYSRNRVLLAGFRELGWEVVECQIKPKTVGRFLKYWQLILIYWRQCRGVKFDLVVVAFPGHIVMPLAYLLFGEQIIFDAFVSLYNSEIEDRQEYAPHSLRAFYYYSLDRLTCRLAKKVLLDTEAHIDYFVNTFKLPASKFIRVFVSTTPDLFYPIETKPSAKFIVHFHGSNIPLQGMAVIIEAARQLVVSQPEIIFRLIGPFANLKVPINIELYAPVSLKKLNELLNEADVVLGIFGGTKKAQLVIPNKVFEGLAVAKPVITGETEAVQELLSDKQNVILCRVNDSVALAGEIVATKNNHNKSKLVAKNGYKLFKDRLLPVEIVSDLLCQLT
ncbi:MAG: glycosyltransferase [Candidatus Vogelbacteria bacterium]|nr:glycosyltransferase [Candidatus Vogelbacteria bacterium]